MAAIERVSSREAEIAGRLLGVRVLRVSSVSGGRNSRVSRVDTRHGAFALKQYPPPSDGRDRLGVETGALQWMARHGIDIVPRVVAIDRTENCALLSWIDGARINEVTAADIDQAIGFLEKLEHLRRTDPLSNAQPASEACLSGRELERQIRARLADLRALEDEPLLRSFLQGEFTEAFEVSLARARQRLSSAHISFEADLVEDQRSLAPSDFGFHNALRDEGGRLAFLDFEYFGWDDPVKLVVDTLLHPAIPVADDLLVRFRTAAEALFARDPDFSTRLKALHPLFILRWSLILLNEFHPARWRQRVHAGARANWAEAKARQLWAARDMLMKGRA